MADHHEIDDDQQYLTFSDCAMLEKCIARSRIVLQNRLTLDVYGGDEQGRVRICGMSTDMSTAIDIVFLASHFVEFAVTRDYSLSLHAADVSLRVLRNCGQFEPLRLRWNKEQHAVLTFIRPPQWTSSIVSQETVEEDAMQETGGSNGSLIQRAEEEEERFVFGQNHRGQQMGSSALANLMSGNNNNSKQQAAPAKRVAATSKQQVPSAKPTTKGDTNISTSAAKRRKQSDTNDVVNNKTPASLEWAADVEHCQITQLPLFIYTKESEFGHFDPEEHGCPLVCEWEVDMTKMKPILSEMISMANASAADKALQICLIMLPTNTLHFIVKTMTVSKRFPIPTNVIRQHMNIPELETTQTNRSMSCMWMCIVTVLQLNAINAFGTSSLLSVSMYAQATSLEEAPPGYILSANFMDLSTNTPTKTSSLDSVNGKYREDIQSTLTMGVKVYGDDSDSGGTESRFRLPKEWSDLFRSR